MGAQVVSGIGFLGAGVIFKEGLNVRGLNTAATLWRSAAVGLLAGMGFLLCGLLCAGIVVASSLILRPLVQAINRQPVDTSEVERTYAASVVCRGADAPQARALLMNGLTSTPDIAFTEVQIVNIEDADRVEVTATATSHKRRDIAFEYIIGRLGQASGVSRASWRTQTLSV